MITSGASGGNSVVGTIQNGTNTFDFDAMRNRLIVGRSARNKVGILSFNTAALADGDLNDPANWSNGVPNGLVAGIIPSHRAMRISSVMEVGQIYVRCGGDLKEGSNSAYIIGSVHRDFCTTANETFVYPVGSAAGYSPVTTSNTKGRGSLTVGVTDTFLPGRRAAAKTLSRYWLLYGSGITTDLTFQYIDADVNGAEYNYALYRRPRGNESLVNHIPSTINVIANTLTATTISQFSDWGAGQVS